MAVKEIKDMGASVLTRLKKQAKETEINYQTCLQLFAQEEFLRKLEMSGYAENLVLKGGMFLYTISNYEGSIILENNLWHNQNRMNYTKHCNRKAIRTAFAGKLLINR